MAKQKICIAGGHGLVGTSLVKRLAQDGYEFVASADEHIDLRDYEVTNGFFEKVQPDCVILVAAKHGGIDEYESKPVEYFRNNLLICTNTITASFDAGIRKLINIGASCVYGSDPTCIYVEEDYDKQAVQKSTEPYGLAKLSGMKLCEYYNKEYGTDYISLLPVNMYGDGKGYKVDFSSVLPAMIQRFHNAKENDLPSVEIWGDGKNTREFLFVDDFIDAVEVIIETNSFESHLFNICGFENISIHKLAEVVADVIGYKGEIHNDLSKPSGASRGRINSSKIYKLGWKPKTSIRQGVEQFYRNYVMEMKG